MGTVSGAVWERYEIGETLMQTQRISRKAGKQLPSMLNVWIDGLIPYYGDHPDGLKGARDYLNRHQKITHSSLPPLVDAWERDGGFFWVYGAFTGPSIPEYLQEHKPSLSALEPLMVDILQGLDALHQDGLNHNSLDTSAVLIVGKRRAVLDNRGIRNHLNGMLDRSTLEGGIATDFDTSAMRDITMVGEILGALLSGEPEFGRVKLTSRATGSFDLKFAQETLRRKGIDGQLADVAMRAARARFDPDDSFKTIRDVLIAFLVAIVRDRQSAGDLR